MGRRLANRNTCDKVRLGRLLWWCAFFHGRPGILGVLHVLFAQGDGFFPAFDLRQTVLEC